MSARSPARSAQLRLRGGFAPLVWPPGDAWGATVLLGDERLGRSLAAALGTVVLSVPARDGAAAIEWIADHGGELGAGGRLILAGAADDVLSLAARVRAQGWPPITLCHILPPSPVEGAWNSTRRSQ